MDDSLHCSRVAEISAAVRARPPGSLLRVGKAGSHTPYSNLAGYGNEQRYAAVDVGGLTRILSIDEAAGLVTVEGGVEMLALCRELLLRGLLPAVSPEGESFTVAGINGFGIQSSSHRFGLFHDAVVELEVVTGEGRVLRASAGAHADLFALLPGSFGTLGLVTAATLRCMRATPRVRTVGSHYADAESFSAGVLRALRGEGAGCTSRGRLAPLPAPRALPADPFPRASAFIEGFAFSRSSFVLLETDFLPADEPPAPPERQCSSAPGSPYYYQYCRDLARAARPAGAAFEFEQGALEYTFRLTRGIWWLLEHHLGVPALTGTRLGRRLLDGALQAAPQGVPRPERGWQPREGVDFSHADYARCLVTQGFYVRTSRLAEMLTAVDGELGIYPLWACPVRVVSAGGGAGGGGGGAVRTAGRLWRRLLGDGGGPRRLLGDGGGPRSPETGWCLDVGCYGVPSAPGYKAFSSVRALQAIADTPSQWGLSYMTREEMRREDGILDAAAYGAARKAYGADGAFPPLWDKVRGYDPAISVDGPVIACWRLKRDGILGCCMCLAAVAAAAVAAFLYFMFRLYVGPTSAPPFH